MLRVICLHQEHNTQCPRPGLMRLPRCLDFLNHTQKKKRKRCKISINVPLIAVYKSQITDASTLTSILDFQTYSSFQQMRTCRDQTSLYFPYLRALQTTTLSHRCPVLAVPIILIASEPPCLSYFAAQSLWKYE